MSTVLTSSYLEQQAELLPARTVLSMLAIQGTTIQGTNSGGNGGSGGSIGEGLLKTLGLATPGGNSTPGHDGPDGQPNQND